ncbi:rhodanese/cell cycle control phosphatase superfamily protein [Spatholobus suberectus]|nr:rhodanese/cell cycle control phosphatase superfamily protein [Spatholobus suberectus]
MTVSWQGLSYSARGKHKSNHALTYVAHSCNFCGMVSSLSPFSASGTGRLVAKGSGTWPDGMEKLQDKGIDARKIDGKGF